jgi:hypothetical protein
MNGQPETATERWHFIANLEYGKAQRPRLDCQGPHGKDHCLVFLHLLQSRIRFRKRLPGWAQSSPDLLLIAREAANPNLVSSGRIWFSFFFGEWGENVQARIHDSQSRETPKGMVVFKIMMSWSVLIFIS